MCGSPCTPCFCTITTTYMCTDYNPMDVVYRQTQTKYILLTVACMQSSDDIAQAHLWLQKWWLVQSLDSTIPVTVIASNHSGSHRTQWPHDITSLQSSHYCSHIGKHATHHACQSSWKAHTTQPKKPSTSLGTGMSGNSLSNMPPWM